VGLFSLHLPCFLSYSSRILKAGEENEKKDARRSGRSVGEEGEKGKILLGEDGKPKEGTMDEKELKLKAMEITRDIVVAAVESGNIEYIKETIEVPYGKNGKKTMPLEVTKYYKSIQLLIETVYSTVYQKLQE